MELWHVLNRGVDGRDIFMNSQDYARFVHNLYECNDADPVINFSRNFDPSIMSDFVSHSSRKKRKRIVDIHGWVLMKNHYHLLLSERVEGGITLFIRKLNIGYVKYFNERYERKGTLFQSRTKKVLIERQAHFLYILHYVHLNPLDYLTGAEKWRVHSRGSIRNINEALNYLDSYRWSSYLDYSGKKNFPSILTSSLFKKVLGNPHKMMKEYLRDSERDNVTSKLILE